MEKLNLVCTMYQLKVRYMQRPISVSQKMHSTPTNHKVLKNTIHWYHLILLSKQPGFSLFVYTCNLFNFILGGDEKARKRHTSKGKMLPRDRISCLLDQGQVSLFLSFNLFIPIFIWLEGGPILDVTKASYNYCLDNYNITALLLL